MCGNEFLQRRQQAEYEGGGAGRVRPVGQSDPDWGAGISSEAAKAGITVSFSYHTFPPCPARSDQSYLENALFGKDKTQDSVDQ